MRGYQCCWCSGQCLARVFVVAVDVVIVVALDLADLVAVDGVIAGVLAAVLALAAAYAPPRAAGASASH